MMFKVLIAEDELASLKYLINIIERKCSGFDVVDTAEDGKDALEKIKKHRPDVLITDIRMPIIDGIELVSKVKVLYPGMYSIIVSGYSEFDYAKGALEAGVVDYLLKPIDVNQMSMLMNKIKKRLKKHYRDKQFDIWRSILNGQYIDEDIIQKYFITEYYNIGVLRKGGLPSRYNTKHFASDKIYDINGINILKNMQLIENTWLLQGRDDNEIIIIASLPNLTVSIESVIHKLIKKQGTEFYYTAIVNDDLISMNNIKKIIEYMLKEINQKVVVGCTQILKYNKEKEQENSSVVNAMLSEMERNKIKFYILNGDYNSFKTELKKWFILWEKDKKPQIWLESIIRQILLLVTEFSLKNKKEEHLNLDILMDEAMYYSNSMDNLVENIWDIIEYLLENQNGILSQQNMENLFITIDEYININFREQLSLQGICNKFGISQTYLSRLFRKYKNMSFNEYLTAIRIEKAKELLLKHPKLKIKEVALSVGYNDPSYFSKVFCKYTGFSPSQYK